ncbi:MAG: hypothetical protein IJ187_08005 [Neisseriaceae bacterium]|nr:hypothetical protein [Neisseriaceae bacterium]
MRALVWIILLFAAAVGLAVLSQHYQGTAHIILANTQYSMNLNTLIIGLLLLWLVLHILIKTAKTIAGLPGGFRRWGRKNRLRQADQALNDAGMAFFSGQYAQTETHIRKLLNNKDAGEKLPLALVLASYAANAAGDTASRDKFLTKLEKQPEKYRLPSRLLMAENALSKGDYATARTNILAALKIAPDSLPAVRLDLRRTLAEKDSDGTLKNIAILQKKKAISQEEAALGKQSAVQIMLKNINNIKDLKRCLKPFSDNEKHGILALDIAQSLRSMGQLKEAVKHIRTAYKHQPNPELLHILSEVFPYLPDADRKKLLEDAERRLTDDKNNIDLLNMAAKMAENEHIWGKAQHWLEQAIVINDTPTLHLALAKIFADSGRADMAEQQRAIALQQLSEEKSPE